MRYVKNLLLGMVFCFTATAAMAGSLDSPAGPTEASSAMYKLEDVYNRANDGTAGTKRTTTFGEPASGPANTTAHTLNQAYDLVSERSRPAKTGQILCYNSSNSAITCDSTTAGQDGATLKGVTWPSTRFTASNGTVTDNLTGLIWLQNANVLGTSVPGDGDVNWALAMSYVVELNTSGTMNAFSAGDTSKTGNTHQIDWRLPNLRELQSLIDYANSAPALPTGHLFTAVQSELYWSSTTLAPNTARAWRVFLDSGAVDFDLKTFTRYVWPVRGGQS
jgi:Protein of unknown function (DUF1566)